MNEGWQSKYFGWWLAFWFAVLFAALFWLGSTAQARMPCPPGWRYGGIVPEHEYSDCCICWRCIAPDGVAHIFIDFKGNTPVPFATVEPPTWTTTPSGRGQPALPALTATVTATQAQPTASVTISSTLFVKQLASVTPTSSVTPTVMKTSTLTPTATVTREPTARPQQPTATRTVRAEVTPRSTATSNVPGDAPAGAGLGYRAPDKCVIQHAASPVQLCETGSGSGWWLYFIGESLIRPGPHIAYPEPERAGWQMELEHPFTKQPVILTWREDRVNIQTYYASGKPYYLNVRRDGKVRHVRW